MPTIEHDTITHASLKCAAWAFQCQVIVNNLTARDPNTTGFHRMAAGRMATRAWNAYAHVALDVGMGPEELERLWTDAAEAAESAANLLMAYSNTLTRSNHHQDTVS